MRRVDVGRACGAALSVCIAGAWGCAPSPAAPAGAAPAGAKERVFTLQEREPTTIEEAQAQLEQARAQLTGAASTPTTPATGATSAPGPGAGGATSTTESPPAHAGSSGEEQRRRCGNACVAMTSMRHAVDAICRMAGETDARCTDARKTLEDSETKVTGCGCPPT